MVESGLPAARCRKRCRRRGWMREDVGDAEAVTADMHQFRQEKDFESLFHLYLRLIEAELWDIQHVDRHLACLEATYDAWVDAEGKDEEED